MMLDVDFHSHTFFSNCGIHTHLEMLTHAKNLGMKGLAITDHGPELHGRISYPFFNRFFHPLTGIRCLKGMECNLVNDSGTIDILQEYVSYLDIVLIGLHPNIKKNKTKTKYTDLLISAIEKNPCIDVITHPNEMDYPVFFEPLAIAARAKGIALELNNSKTKYRRTTPDKTRELLRTCKRIECSVAIGSDAHTLEEIGLDDSVRPFLIEEKFPDDLIVNSTAKKAFAFIEKRKLNKKRNG